MLPQEQLMRGQQVLLADSEDLWDEQYQMEVSRLHLLKTVRYIRVIWFYMYIIMELLFNKSLL